MNSAAATEATSCEGEANSLSPHLSRATGTAVPSASTTQSPSTNIAAGNVFGDSSPPTARNDSIKALDSEANILADSKPTSFDLAVTGAKDSLAATTVAKLPDTAADIDTAVANAPSTAAKDSMQEVEAEGPADTKSSSQASSMGATTPSTTVIKPASTTANASDGASASVTVISISRSN